MKFVKYSVRYRERRVWVIKYRRDSRSRLARHLSLNGVGEK